MLNLSLTLFQICYFSGCITQVPFKPVVVNPFSVAMNSSGKKRSILDLSVFNNFVRKDKVKFEHCSIFQKGIICLNLT